MKTPQDSTLGRHVDYPREYDATLLFPIARSLGRDALSLKADTLPFAGLRAMLQATLDFLGGDASLTSR